MKDWLGRSLLNAGVGAAAGGIGGFLLAAARTAGLIATTRMGPVGPTVAAPLFFLGLMAVGAGLGAAIGAAIGWMLPVRDRENLSLRLTIKIAVLAAVATTVFIAAGARRRAADETETRFRAHLHQAPVLQPPGAP